VVGFSDAIQKQLIDPIKAVGGAAKLGEAQIKHYIDVATTLREQIKSRLFLQEFLSPADASVKDLQNQVDDLAKFINRLQAKLPTPAGQKPLPTTAINPATATGKTVAELTSALNQLKSAYKSLLSQVSPNAKAFFELKTAEDTLKKVTPGLRAEFDKLGLTLPSNDEILKQVRRNLVGAAEDAGTLNQKLGLINDALKKNAISAQEAANLSRDATISYLDAQTDFSSGVERTFLKLQKASEDTASQIEEALNGAFKSAGDAVVSFVQTGKLSLDSFFKDIEAQLLRSATNSLLGDLGASFGFGKKTNTSLLGSIIGQSGGGGAGGGGGLFGGGFFSGIGDLLGFASGGSFKVGPDTSLGSLSGVDNRLIAFRAKDGEHVSVSNGSGATQPIQVSYTIVTPDANSFKKSQGQILNDTHLALARAGKRNG
jgi:lambda family phage tail tape measure protein